MKLNINWLTDVAAAALRASEREPMYIDLLIEPKGVRVSGRSRGWAKELVVSWNDLAAARFNPLLPAIEDPRAALQRALEQGR